MAGSEPVRGGGAALSAKPASTRERILRAAVRLFQSRGYASVGVNDILEAAQAPKGSLYHHFPGGKEQLAIAALEWLSGEVERWLTTGLREGRSGADMIETLAAGMASWLERSGWREGCIVAALAHEAAPDIPAIHVAVRAAYGRWRAILRGAFIAEGRDEAAAEALADLAIAVAEGGLILARADGSAAPLMRAAKLAADLARA